MKTVRGICHRLMIFVAGAVRVAYWFSMPQKILMVRAIPNTPRYETVDASNGSVEGGSQYQDLGLALTAVVASANYGGGRVDQILPTDGGYYVLVSQR